MAGVLKLVAALFALVVVAGGLSLHQSTVPVCGGSSSEELIEMTRDAVNENAATLKHAAAWRLLAVILAAAVPLVLGYLVLRECCRQEPQGEDVVREMVEISGGSQPLLHDRCRDLIVRVPPSPKKRVRRIR